MKQNGLRPSLLRCLPPCLDAFNSYDTALSSMHGLGGFGEGGGDLWRGLVSAAHRLQRRLKAQKNGKSTLT